MVTHVQSVPSLPPRAEDSHKGSYGTVVVVAGSGGMLGAAILASRAALRSGAGLVVGCVPAELRGVFAAAVPCATSRARTGSASAWLAGASAAVVGPGLTDSDATRQLVADVCEAASVPMVLDADALNVLAPLDAPVVPNGAAILTPHPGEAGRLLGCASAEVQGRREDCAVELARRSGQVVVLKGAGTLVTDGERLYTNATGNPGMATGGSGDVLSGLLGALLAQGLPPFDAACLGVHVHGAAGDLVAQRLSQAGLTAEDLPLAIAEVLAR